MRRGEAVTESYLAVPDSVPRARTNLAALAAAAGASRQRVDEIRLAVSEAVTNAVVHAYRGRPPGRIQVTAAEVSGEMWVLIADDGSGLDARADSEGLGTGLALISQLSDDFAIVKRSSGGTEVRMRFDLVDASDAGPPHSRGSVASAVAPA